MAELVLAGPQYRTTGKLRLGVVPGGFATILSPRLRVARSLVTDPEGVTVAIGGRTPRAIGAELGVTAGRPEGAYEGGSGVDPDETLTLDPDQADVIVEALGLGHDALVTFAADETPVLWPEHFDVAITRNEVNYGVSPGDGHLAEPYAYVGPWAARVGPFWNVEFGAARLLGELEGHQALLDFFQQGASLAVTDPARA